MDKMQKKNQTLLCPTPKQNWKGKRARLLQESGLEVLSEPDQKDAIMELLSPDENTKPGLISH